MDLKQFRIGNYAGEHEYATNGFVHQIERVDCYCVPGEVVFSNGDTSSNPFGILLDEDWLLKLGFVKYTHSLFEHPPFDGQRQMKYSMADGFGLQTVRSGFVWYIPEIKYVHQVQNLYYALTGTELVVSSAVGKV